MDNPKRSCATAMVVAFILGALVGIGGHRFWVNRFYQRAASFEGVKNSAVEEFGGETPGELNTTPQEVNVPSSMEGGDKNSIVVSDQAAGSTVALKNVTLAEDAWVAIHEDAGGQPGKILGAQLFLSGSHSGIVELLRNTKGGSVYYAMIHSDDGDKEFDFTTDLPYQGSDGKPLMARFTTNP